MHPRHSLPTPSPHRALSAADVKRLFDLVNCKDDKLRLAFYYAMRDTVVAKDLDQATRIAYGQDRRWRRVVTVKVGCPPECTARGRGGAARDGRVAWSLIQLDSSILLDACAPPHPTLCPSALCLATVRLFSDWHSV